MPGNGQRPGRRWNWHRLDDEWAHRIVDAAGVHKGDVVVEFGAGDGALTEPLLRTGARVIAVELHPRRAELLRERFAGTAVRVVEMDAREFTAPGRPFRVVANPPFSIATELLARLVRRDSALTAADLVLPDFTARRFCERPDGRAVGAEMGLRVPRRAFTPPAPADAVVLRLRPQRHRQRHRQRLRLRLR